MIPEILLSLLVGIALAAACGLRIFVPLLALSAAAHFGHFALSPGFAWLGSWGALIALAAATVVEIVSYHVPWLDHLLDVAGAPLAVAAGVIVMAASMDQVSPFVRWALAVLAGGGVAGLFQGLTGMTRLGSTMMTGGAGNPAFASAESGSAIVVSILAIVIPLVALLALVLLGAFALRRGLRLLGGRG